MLTPSGGGNYTEVMRRKAIALYIVLAVLPLRSHAQPQAGFEVAVHDYVEALSSPDRLTLDDLRGSKIAWRTMQGGGSHFEIDRLRREVGDLVDHPLRPELERQLRLQAMGGNCRECTFWGDGQRWRFTEREGCGERQVLRGIRGVTGTQVWFVSGLVMSVRSLSEAPPPGMYYETAGESRVVPELNALLNVGVSKRPDAPRFTVTFGEGTKWRAHRPSFNTPGANYVLEGGWDAVALLPTVQRSFNEDAQGRVIVESSVSTYSGWTHWGPSARWMPSVKVVDRGSGDVVRTELLAWDLVDEQTLALAWMLPTREGDDLELGHYRLEEIREVQAPPPVPADLPPVYAAQAATVLAAQPSTTGWWPWIAAGVGVAVVTGGGLWYRRRPKRHRRIFR